MVFESSHPLLILWLIVLLSNVGVLKSPAIILNCLFLPSTLSFLLHVSWGSVVKCICSRNCSVCLIDWHFYYDESIPLYLVLVLKRVPSDVRVAAPALWWIFFPWCPFPSFYFQTHCVCESKASLLQTVYVLILFFIPCDNVCLAIGLLNTSVFNVSVDSVGFTRGLLLFVVCLAYVFLFLYSCLLLSFALSEYFLV